MLSTRGILVHPFEFDMIWVDNAVSLGLNTIGLHPVGGKNAADSLQELIDTRGDIQKIKRYANDKGLKVEYEMHALSWLLPRKLFYEHPSWFRTDEKGERNADFNMCASNEEALEYISERAALLTGLLPSDSHKYYYWIDDVPNSYCNCEKCRVLSASDQQTLIMNAMIKGVKMADPDGKLAYLAYFNTNRVPENVKPDNDLFLEFAPFNRSFAYAMNDIRCHENTRETENLPKLLECFGKEDAKVLEYWTDNSMFSKWTMPPKPYKLDPEIMRKDVRWYRSLGFDSITAFSCFLGKEYRELYGMPELEDYGNIMCE